MMDMGTHDPINGIDRETAPTVHPSGHALERERRGMFCHTCGKWIEWPKPESYGVMPGNLGARGDAGWLDDGDRDSTQAAKLAELVKDMDASVRRWLDDSSATCEEAERIMGLWQAIRKITQSNQTNEGKQ